MTTISAKTILRSRNTYAPEKVLSTLLLRYPRFIHAEFMTHRAFSRNAASSRAIPVKKMIDDILADTAMPLHWGANQKGMQADQECNEFINFGHHSAVEAATGVFKCDRQMAWVLARDYAIEIARAFEKAGYHKQIVNRLLEPFMHITVLVSATEWDNFLELRDHKDAEPHIQILAREISNCLDQDTVQELRPGQWHLPFVTTFDEDFLYEASGGDHNIGVEQLRKLSVARCASTSYKTVDGFDMTLEKAKEVYGRLFSKPFHASPFEHIAQADEGYWLNYGERWSWNNAKEHGNFVGFRQYRRQLELAQ